MNIQSISAYDCCPSKPAFKASYVTLSKQNLGEKISRNVVDSFNGKILPQLRESTVKEAQSVIDAVGAGRVINKPADYQDKINFFALAAGSGSRFSELAQTVGDYNKISLPFKINENLNLHMLDFAMAMGKFFVGKEGVNKIVAPEKSGSFGDIVKHYQAGNPITDTVVCCGDNVFGDKAVDMMKFFTRVINDPNKHVALVGVARTPEEVAKRFGVLQVEGSLGDEALKLTGFSEKPPLEEAEQMAVDGMNIANTGMFYISKEAMEKLMAEINSGVNNIKKNESEPYDFANAVKYVHKMLPEWFGIKSSEGADVKVVDKWEDIGEPKALYQFAEDVKNGQYLGNFTKGLADDFQKAFTDRIHVKDAKPYIAFTDSAKVSEKQIADAKNVEGVSIIV